MALKMRVNLGTFWSIVTVCRMNMPKSAVFVWSTYGALSKDQRTKPARADGLWHDEDLEQETIRWKLRMDIDNGYDYQVESSGRKHPRPMRSEFPKPQKMLPLCRLYITQAIDMFTFQIYKKTRLLFLSK